MSRIEWKTAEKGASEVWPGVRRARSLAWGTARAPWPGVRRARHNRAHSALVERPERPSSETAPRDEWASPKAEPWALGALGARASLAGHAHHSPHHSPLPSIGDLAHHSPLPPRQVFDALEKVDHDKKDRTIIRKMHGAGGKGHEEIMFVKPVPAQGNIEDWLTVLLKYMQKTMKYLCSNAGTHMAAAGTEITTLRHFVDEAKAQFALLGIQFMWTTDTQNSLEECSKKKNSMKECNSRQLDVLRELSSWCLQDLGFKVNRRAAQESEIPNFKGSYLGRFPLVSADFWTSDHLSERSRSVAAFSGTRARGTLTLKRR